MFSENIFHDNKTFILYKTLATVGSEDVPESISDDGIINAFVIFIKKPDESGYWHFFAIISASSVCGILVLATMIYTLKKVSIFIECCRKIIK